MRSMMLMIIGMNLVDMDCSMLVSVSLARNSWSSRSLTCGSPVSVVMGLAMVVVVPFMMIVMVLRIMAFRCAVIVAAAGRNRHSTGRQTECDGVGIYPIES